MQTLKVFSCRSLKELPKDIKELVNLKHLDDNECGALRNMPRGLGQLTCLQTLPLFVVSKDSSSTTTKNVYYNKKKKKKKIIAIKLKLLQYFMQSVIIKFEVISLRYKKILLQ